MRVPAIAVSFLLLSWPSLHCEAFTVPRYHQQPHHHHASFSTSRCQSNKKEGDGGFDISSVDDVVAAAVDAIKEAEEALLEADNNNNDSDETSGSSEDQLQAIISGLRTEAEEAGERASKAEEEVSRLKTLVRNAEAELSETSNKLSSAESKFGSVAENLLSQITNQKTSNKIEAGRARKRQRELEMDVASLRGELDMSRQLLAEQQEAASEKKTRLLDAEDELEMMQNEMRKETSELGRKIKEEQTKLADTERRAEQEINALREKNERDLQGLEEVQRQLDAAQEMFEIEREKLEEQLEAGIRERRSKAESMSRRYERIRSQMTALWRAALREKQSIDRKLKVDVADRDEAITNLKYELNEVKEKSDTLREERDIMTAEKDAVAAERTRIKTELLESISKKDYEIVQLTNDIKELKSRGDIYEEEISMLKRDLSMELSTRKRLDAQLAEERIVSQAEKKRLLERSKGKEAELANKTAEMQRKFDKMRKEMIDLLAKSKNAAEFNEKMLTEKYESEIATKIDIIGGLEAELTVSRNANDVLRAEKAVALEKIRYLDQQVINRNADIASLQRAVAARDNKIEKYEGKYREIFKLGINLTRNRLKKLFRRRRRSG